MPFVLFIAYILLESLAFWAVAQWIGVLWALLALALTMLFGMSIASWEVRRMMSSPSAHPVTAPTLWKIPPRARLPETWA